jgi:hypothetical protein
MTPLPALQWHPFQSKTSHVATTAYDPRTATMYVRFKDQSVYAYPKTPPTGFTALLRAPSPGKHLRAAHPKGVVLAKAKPPA